MYFHIVIFIKDIRNITAFYCDYAFGGALRKGMMTSVNALYNSLRNEQIVNNFTTRSGKIIYDLEASVIVARIANKLATLFK
jgi:hypothetical protein